MSDFWWTWGARSRSGLVGRDDGDGKKAVLITGARRGLRENVLDFIDKIRSET